VNRQALSVFITEARVKAQLSRKELAAAVGVDPSQVTRWEKGTSVPKIRRAGSLAAALHVDKGELQQLIGEATEEEAADAKRDAAFLRSQLDLLYRRYEQAVLSMEELAQRFERSAPKVVD